MGFWDTMKEEFKKGKEQSEDMMPTKPSDMSESAHEEAQQQASQMKQDIDPETLVNGMGANRCPVEVIDKSENIQYLLKTADVDVDNDDVGSLGYTLVTDERVIIVAGKIISTGIGTQHSISYHNISDVSLGQGMLTEVLEVRTPGHEYEITGMNQSVAEPMYNYISQQTQSSEKSGSSGSLDKLERLADLRDEGAISKEEFRDKKSELLDEI